MLNISRFVFLLLFLPTFLSNFVHAQDACKDILSIGLRDSYEMSYSTALDDSLRDWACSDHFTDFENTHSSGFDIGYGGYQLGSTDSKSDKAVTSIRDCKEFAHHINNETAMKIATTVLSPITKDVIPAWQECMKSAHSSNGVTASIESYSPVDDDFTISIRWHNIRSDQRVPLVNTYDIKNAVCLSAKTYLDKTIFGRQEVRDINLNCHRESKSQRVKFSMITNQGPMEPDAVIPIYSPPPTGHCGTYCSSCSLVNNAYSCSSCKVKVAQLLEKSTDGVELAVGTDGIGFSCISLPRGQRYTVSAQGTLSNDNQTIIRTTSYYVGDKTVDTGETVDWGMTAGFVFDGDPNFHTVFELSKYTSRNYNQKGSDALAMVPSSGTISGFFRVTYNVMSARAPVPLKVKRDFVISIDPE